MGEWNKGGVGVGGGKEASKKEGRVEMGMGIL